jgi:hypothetical protein
MADETMRSITGRDEFIIAEALATALVALEQLSAERQPRGDMGDMRRLLGGLCPGFNVSLHLARAKCRLFPDLDPLVVYCAYGIDEERNRDSH